ncbi:porin family protein [Sphingomonas sp. HITSZ_GF]|uniref:outer membrane protein n=1 Tax=Sphingomonas sp. HITSZ_GF TaxID=3037247 RepID=UPI00240E020A|nr:porin family protein [Sphingomonas sp. HITSZ_GF]MDG2533126.1 porin family protein [Sphingomonas sp. HITSZ_GF]
MRNSMLFFAATATLFGAQAALAQESEQAPAKAFAGPRAEVTVGIDQSNDDAFAGGSELTSMRVGGAVGYDVAIGKRVTLGIEAGIGWGIAGHTPVMSTAGATPYSISAGHDADISARIGYALSPKTLIYAKAGWADAAYRLTTGNEAYYDNNDKGVRFGAGIEQKLTKQVYAKAEYRYSMYGNAGYEQDTGRHQLLTGIGVRF